MHFLVHFSFIIYFEKHYFQNISILDWFRKKNAFLHKHMTSSGVSLKDLVQDSSVTGPSLFSLSNSFSVHWKQQIILGQIQGKGRIISSDFVTQEFYCLYCRFFPRRVQADMTLSLSYLEGWHTRHAGNSTELLLFHLKTEIVCISHSPCVFVSLRTILVVVVMNPLSIGHSSGCRHRECSLKVLGTMAVVWKKSCCPRMQWGVPISHLEQWIFVCMIANDISSTFIAATGRDEWLKHVFIQWS